MVKPEYQKRGCLWHQLAQLLRKQASKQASKQANFYNLFSNFAQALPKDIWAFLFLGAMEG